MNIIVMVVAAHADDEALGCGGTIARHVADGDTVHAIFLADGVSSRPDSDKQEVAHRRATAEEARQILGIATATFLDFPDNRLDSMPLIDVIQPLEAVLHKIQPQIVYTHHHGDLNVDHRIAHEAVLIACRPRPGNSVREILTFEVMSSTEWACPGQTPFEPNLFVDISAYFEIKMKALEAYATEMRLSPHSRSTEHILSLAQHRGYCAGLAKAEAFFIVRKIC